MSDVSRTKFAMQALSLADMFNALMNEEPIGSYRVELAAPDGPSTGGGKQAVQHIRLLSDHSPTITAGSANSVAKRAELRSYENLAQAHAQRFKGEALALDRLAYNKALDKMRKIFAQQRMSVVLIDVAAVPMVPTLAEKSSSSALVLSLFAIVLIGLGLAFFFFGRH
jgi:hypothetical protein